MNKTEWTGERLETFIENETTIEHLHRYGITLELVKNLKVLDLACGSGYGSHLMSKYAREVVGVDIDESAILYAKKSYIRDNLRFITGSADRTLLENNYFDVVVSFETIEHHDKHDEMLREIKRVLKPGGLLVISSPDKLNYSDLRNFKNKYHVKELYEEEFKSLLKKHFVNCKFYTQISSYYSVIIEEGKIEIPSIYLTGDYNNISANQKWEPLYWIGICSDTSIPDTVVAPFFGGASIYQSIQAYIHNRYRKSYSYRIGHIILTPIRLLNKVLISLKIKQ